MVWGTKRQPLASVRFMFRRLLADSRATWRVDNADARVGAPYCVAVDENAQRDVAFTGAGSFDPL
ncbi:MAG: hypothetical protein LBJ38_03100, partial [Oscillospiraceae bacterium]|nr:hypothetical protein [Oscillospiraceae bacterium]